MAHQSNLLLLDEPTNHLDLAVRRPLVQALQDFSGAVILVSHDRFLLRTVVDRIYLVEKGTVPPFGGDLDVYRARRGEEIFALSRSENSAGATKTQKPNSRERTRRKAEFQ